MGQENSVEQEPIAELAGKLVDVAMERANMQVVPDMILRILPKDKVEAAEFVARVRRLSHATEQAFRMAQEIFYNVRK